jgi:hypothetical protein
MVKAEVPLPGAAIGFGLKLTVVPAGTPAAVRLMELLKLPLMVVVIVELPCWPWVTVTDDGEAEIVKSLGGGPPQLGNFKDARRVLQSKVAVTV